MPGDRRGSRIPPSVLSRGITSQYGAKIRGVPPIPMEGDSADRSGCLSRSFAMHFLQRRLTLMKKSGIDLVIDVGANQGQFARTMRDQLSYRGRIVSFEPLTNAFAALRRAAAGDPSWICYNIAL